MPGIPLVARETSYSRSTDQMCRQDSRVHLSAEEELAAEESLSVYCKPVELYNIIQRRAVNNPSFLQRCLRYKIKEKHKRGIKIFISVSSINDEVLNMLPLYITVARLVPHVGVSEQLQHCCVYRFKRIHTLTSNTAEGHTQIQANFCLPEVKKLATQATSQSLAILFFTCVKAPKSSAIIDEGQCFLDVLAQSKEHYCLWGKIPLESLYRNWESLPNFSWGQRADFICTIDLLPCFLKSNHLNKNKCITIEAPCNPETMNISKRMQITICAQEFGARENSVYSTYTLHGNPSSSYSRLMRLREGNVVFNYKYYNNKMYRTEVTEDFCCAFCLVKCGSYKGLRYHLTSSHDLFHFDFWATEEIQAVNVSVKTDHWRFEIVADGVDPMEQTFTFCKRPLRRKRSRDQAFKDDKHVCPLLLQSPFSSQGAEHCEKTEGTSSPTAQLCADADCIPSTSGNILPPPVMLPFGKMRKLLVERSDSRNAALLRKQQFYHSHRAQPMAYDQVISNEDSEDEVDDGVADLEDRRMLDDFVDVTKNEKQIMHMWNSFVRKQRVLADGHIPWACEAFSKLHGPDLVRAPPLFWGWRLLMIKLWNHGLLDAQTMDECSRVLDGIKNEIADPKS